MATFWLLPADILKRKFDELATKTLDWRFELTARPQAKVVHHKPAMVAFHPSSSSIIAMLSNGNSCDAADPKMQRPHRSFGPIGSVARGGLAAWALERTL